MGFVGVCRAVYDFGATTDAELTIKDGDLLFVLEKGEDGWWKAKRKADNDGDEEPEGLVPAAYVEEAESLGNATALFEYTRQTDEELSFDEDATLIVYDKSDPDWTLVGCKGTFGFVPANYIEHKEQGVEEEQPPPKPARPSIPDAPVATPTYTQQGPPSPPAESQPAAASAIANILSQQQNQTHSPTASRSISSPRAVQFTPEASDEDEGPAPSLPQRPGSQVASPPRSAQIESPSMASERSGVRASSALSPGAYRMYNIHEMVSHQGKNRKMPTTLGINLAKGTIMISPEKSRDGPQNEWTADKLSHYSLEGKHVFMELVRPSKSIDFHAGAKETATEIVAQLGELAGASRAEGFREILSAASGSSSKRGVMLYDFMAQGDDEVDVAAGDEIFIVDDRQSEEWWTIRRVKNGKQGVVPSSYVEVTGPAAPAPEAASQLSSREQNRIEEERQTREAIRLSQKEAKAQEKKNRDKSQSKADAGKSKPNPNKVRLWHDRSGGFRVDAEFLGLKDGKIHLHKLNGVKIAVPASKMSMEDIELVEKITGESLDEEKPLSEIKRRSMSSRSKEPVRESTPSSSRSKAGAAIEPSKPQYDWFDFFLSCNINPQICERYASAFSKDQMGEENMEDINPILLRTLGMKEGDILRVMKTLDAKFNRTRTSGSNGGTPDGTNGDGLFTGPGGTLRNNTRKGRPAPAVATNDTVDPRAFEQDAIRKEPRSDSPAVSEQPPTPPPKGSTTSGFDDNFWDPRPTKTRPAEPARASHTASTSAPPPVARPAQPPTGAMAELSLLSEPLKPTPAPQSQPQAPVQVTAAQPPQSPPPAQANGANPQFFNQLVQNPSGFQPQVSAPRQRPQPPLQMQSTQSTLLSPPPPSRSMSAPNNNQSSAFAPPPIMPQMTGYQQQSHPAPPGQSMEELSQQRMMQQQQQQQQQQQYQQFQPQPTGYGFQQNMTGMPGQQQFVQNFGAAPYQLSQPTGFQPQQMASPFADPPRQQFGGLQPQQTGYPSSYMHPSQFQGQPTGINSFLPPPLQPQPTGAMNGFGNAQPQSAFGQGPPPPMPPMPPQPQQPAQQLAPLQPQKTGPAPPVRFGVSDAPKLTPQLTGRRANLSQATPQNPFGF